jgi:hypothetical protein
MAHEHGNALTEWGIVGVDETRLDHAGGLQACRTGHACSDSVGPHGRCSVTSAAVTHNTRLISQLMSGLCCL